LYPEEENGERDNWENFCEQKFSQTLSKNFDWITRRERRVIKTLIEEDGSGQSTQYILIQDKFSNP